MSQSQDWSWVTNEMFSKKLEEVVCEMGYAAVLQIPGVYEACAEHLNNTVLEELEAEFPDFDDASEAALERCAELGVELLAMKRSARHPNERFVVLCERDVSYSPHLWVTWVAWPDGTFEWGHYFTDKAEAEEDLATREAATR